MFCDKVVFYYFCLGISLFMFLIVIGLAVFGWYVDGNLNDAGPLIRKSSAVGLAFLIPPAFYRIASKPQKEKTETGTLLKLAFWMIILFLYATATGLLFAGAIKAALWVFAASFFPLVCFIFYAILSLVKNTQKQLNRFWRVFDFFNGEED